MVGQIVAAKLAELGHDVVIGTRDVDASLARTEPSMTGAPGFGTWHAEHSDIKVATFEKAAAGAEMIVMATAGVATVDAAKLAGAANLDGKIVIDISNPLDFSQGMPPSLAVCNTDSVGEQLQRAFPKAKVVKTLNTVTAYLMVDPGQLADGEHTMFVSGNDAEAKATVTELLKQELGWKHVIDLGDITTARGTEMYLPLWVRLWGSLDTPMLNVSLVHQPA